MYNNKVTIREIKRISKDEARFKSFKVTISRPDLPRVLQPDFWPEGVCVRRFYDRKENPQKSKDG
jgi:hypothetical protein